MDACSTSGCGTSGEALKTQDRRMVPGLFSVSIGIVHKFQLKKEKEKKKKNKVSLGLESQKYDHKYILLKFCQLLYLSILINT